jgi:hypothetical protein
LPDAGKLAAKKGISLTGPGPNQKWIILFGIILPISMRDDSSDARDTCDEISLKPGDNRVMWRDDM